MEVYLINIALIIFWRLHYNQNRVADSRKNYCTIVAIQWILISGLRGLDVGADTYAYYNVFENVKNTSWGTLLRGLVGYLFGDAEVKDPGYSLLTKLFQLFFGDYQIFLLAIATLFMSLMAIWIYKNSASPCTSFILFSTLFYSFYAVTGHRQTIATALIVFIGYDLIKQRKFWKFIAVAFAAFLIHKSSLVFVPLYFIVRIPVTTLYKILCAVVIALIAGLGERLYGPIALWIGYHERQITYEGGGAELYSTLLVLLCLIIWFLYPRIRAHRDDAQLLFHINIMTLLSGLLAIQNQGFMRIQQYFSLFLMITIPEAINTVKRKYRLLVYMLFGMVMILYLMRNNPQYQFFFLN